MNSHFKIHPSLFAIFWLSIAVQGCGGGASTSQATQFISGEANGSATDPSESDTASETYGQSSATSGASSDGSHSAGESEGTTNDADTDVGNHPPQANADEYFFTDVNSFNVSAVDGLLKNDSDPDGDEIQVVSVEPTAAGGIINFQSDGGFTYIPPANFWGCDSTIYTITDSHGATDQSTIQIQVDPPRVQYLATMAAHKRAILVEGVEGEQSTGSNVLSLGDINSDGYDDILIDSSGFQEQGKLGGHLYVVHGRANVNHINLSEVLAGTGGFPIVAESDFVAYNSAIEKLGDLNGDGLDELLIGKAKKVYVVFGKPGDNGKPIYLKWLSAINNGFAILPQEGPTPWGSDVAVLDDLNGDGKSEIVVAFNNSEASIYVVFGYAYDNDISLNDVGTSIPGYVIEKDKDYQIGSLTNAGDVNGDGFDDLLIGVGSYGAYVVFGKSNMQTVKLAELETKKAGFKIILDSEIEWSSLGEVTNYLSPLGDINSDGFADILIGGKGRPKQADSFLNATAYAIYGKANSIPLSVSELYQSNGGFVMRSDHNSAPWGLATALAGFDMNGDGLSEMLLGDHEANNETGRIFLVKSRPASELIDLLDETAEGVFRFEPPPNQRLGWSVNSAGDFNGDGSVDFMAGAIATPGGGQFEKGNPGLVYVVLGPRQCLSIE